MATLIQNLQYVLEGKDLLLSVDIKRIVLKEALQAYILDYLYNHAHYRRLNFYGGTCLHVLYQLNRLSEDLDLDNSNGVDLSHLGTDLCAYFHKHVDFPQASFSDQIGEKKILRVTLKFPVLYSLGLTTAAKEALHVKLEVSQHKQVSVIQATPVFYFGRSFVPAHFSLETMMAGKMLACLERNFQRGKDGATIKGRDFYDLLWFMQKQVQPLKEKLAKDGRKEYFVHSAMLELREKVKTIQVSDLAVDLLPLFESRVFIEAWLESFHANFGTYLEYYL